MELEHTPMARALLRTKAETEEAYRQIFPWLGPLGMAMANQQAAMQQAAMRGYGYGILGSPCPLCGGLGGSF